MPFLAALPAVAGPLIGLGSSLIGGLLGKKGSKQNAGATPLLPAGLDTQGIQASVGKQAGLGDTITKSGQTNLSQGSAALSDPLNFYSQILGGDRTAIMQSLAPEIAAINAQFAEPTAQAGITGRETGLLPDLDAKKQSAISAAIFGARPAAADKKAGIASGLMNLGATQEGLGADVQRSVTGDIIDYNKVIRGLQFEGMRDTAGMYGKLGTDLGSLLTQLLIKKPGAAGPAAPPIPKITLPDWPSTAPLPGPGGFG